ncbi:MAG: phosphate/phosphite/phosphonate ABC transporter substrate-binding protein [Gammaproteobacteria bacterium]
MKKILCVLFILFFPIFCAAKTYTFGIELSDWSGLSINQQLPSYKNLLAQLGEATGLDFKLKVYKSRKELAKDLAKGDIDIAYIKVMTFFFAQKRNDQLKPLLVSTHENKENEHSLTYSAYIITPKKHDIHSIKELKNKPFGFTEKYAAGSFAYTVYYFQQIGIDYKTYFSSHQFYHTSRRLFRALLKGEVDGGSVYDKGFDSHPDADNMRILKTMTHIPDPMVVLNDQMDASDAEKIHEALIKIKPIGLPFNGFVNVPNGFYARAKIIFDRVYGNKINH